MINIRYPNITGRTEADQIKQIVSHIRYMVDQLNWLQNVWDGQGNSASNVQNKPVTDAKKLGGSTIEELKSALIDSIYPVGSIYISSESTSPQILFGGTWTQIKDTFLLASGSFYSAGSTGGEAYHKLTVDEIPSHNHNLQYSTDGGETYNTANMGKDGTSTNTHYFGGSQSVTSFATYRARIGFTGGGYAHNNMPPYLAVFMWKRIA